MTPEYRGRRNAAGLLLMPASRHLVSHCDKEIRLRRKILYGHNTGALPLSPTA